jgi:hypothetical protein
MRVVIFILALPEVKTSDCQTTQSTKGTKNDLLRWLFSPFSGLVFSEARGFNLWWRRLNRFSIDAGSGV